jgi:hypothetical protein
MRFNEILEGTRADIAVKVFGDDFVVIERIAAEVREILERVPGAADVEFDALGKSPCWRSRCEARGHDALQPARRRGQQRHRPRPGRARGRQAD